MGKPVAPAFDQDAFRARTNVPNPLLNAAFDAGDAALNANWAQDVDVLIRVRFVIQQTVAGASNHDNTDTEFLLQYNKNGGGWNDVAAIGADTDPVQYMNAVFTDGDNTTQLLGSGTFVAGDGVEITPTDTIVFTESALTETEIEFAIEIVSGQVADGDTIQLRLIYSDTNESPPATVCEAYTNTPTMTVSEDASVDITVPVAALTLTSYAPTIQTPVNITVPVASLALTGYAPTVEVTENVEIEIPVTTLSLIGYPPTVETTAHINIEVPVAALALTAYAPVVDTGGGIDIEVPAGALALTGYAPTVTVTAHIDIEIPAATLTLTGYPPDIEALQGLNITIPTGALALTGYAPIVTVTEHVDIEVPAGVLTLTGYAPAVDAQANVDIEIPVAALVLTGYAPTISVATPFFRTLTVQGEHIPETAYNLQGEHIVAGTLEGEHIPETEVDIDGEV